MATDGNQLYRPGFCLIDYEASRQYQRLIDKGHPRVYAVFKTSGMVEKAISVTEEAIDKAMSLDA